MADANEECDFMVTKEKKAKEGAQSGPSLQANFSKFLQEKKEERRLLQTIANNVQRTPEFKEALRNKFIQQAKSYFGVPYAQKYQPEGSPVLPLYLDCCGLIRQCLKDLRTEFGFMTGKWNQVIQLNYGIILPCCNLFILFHIHVRFHIFYIVLSDILCGVMY